jgi:NitT/TauT family transport system substrate-binding protein
VAAGEIDLGLQFSGPLLTRLEANVPLVTIGGVHVGCFELFGTEQIRTIRDLKGKTVAITDFGAPEHIFLASMLAYVGLDPSQDVNWVTYTQGESKLFLAAGTIDAVLAFPPDSHELRAKQIGHVVVNSMVDRPWSQYFCCMVIANRDFVRKYPVATKRALRAILKGADICAAEPERAARFMVDRGFTPNYEYALATMKSIPYNKWREYDPEDTLRFFALRLREAGMIKSSPEKLLAQGTDWRFFNELKKELKA